jgi:hypothetical protein
VNEAEAQDFHEDDEDAGPLWAAVEFQAGGTPVRHELADDLERIERKVDRLMTAQDDVNAAVSAVSSFLSDLSTQVQAIGARLDAGGSGTPVDTSKLNAIVAQLPAAQAAVDALAAGGTGTGTGPVVTPPVPASGVAVTNPDSASHSVEVSDGTGSAIVTGVAVNARQVGAGPGTYTVPAGGTIAVTWSAAVAGDSPAWTWS